MTNHVALREFIETIIALNNQRRDDLRAEDLKSISNAFAALDKALVLQSGSYPTVKDFNDLKTHVDVELASRSGSSSTVTTLFQVMSALGMAISVAVAFLMYLK